MVTTSGRVHVRRRQEATGCVYIDNQRAIAMANNHMDLGGRTKHINIKYHFVQEEQEDVRLHQIVERCSCSCQRRALQGTGRCP